MTLTMGECDMVNTDLCKWYQKRGKCHYKATHLVSCPLSDSELKEQVKK